MLGLRRLAPRWNCSRLAAGAIATPRCPAQMHRVCAAGSAAGSAKELAPSRRSSRVSMAPSYMQWESSRASNPLATVRRRAADAAVPSWRLMPMRPHLASILRRPVYLNPFYALMQVPNAVSFTTSDKPASELSTHAVTMGGRGTFLTHTYVCQSSRCLVCLSIPEVCGKATGSTGEILHNGALTSPRT